MKRLLLGFVATAAFSSFARPYNYEDIPLGERSSSMGLTSMAFESDASAIFTNPATCALSSPSKFSASVSAYAKIDARVGSYVSLFQSAVDNITQGGFVSVPSSVGGYITRGNWKLGGAVLIPAYYEDRATIEYGETRSVAYDSALNSVWIGGFAGQRVSESTTLGATLFYASSEMAERFYDVDTEPIGSSRIRFSQNTYNANGLVLVLGGHTRLSDAWSWGYSFRTPPIVLSGRGTFVDASSDEATEVREEFSQRRMALPWRLSTGLAYRASPSLLWALDLHLYGPYKFNSSPTGQASTEFDASTIVNTQLGVDYKLWEDFGIRWGFYTNLSSSTKKSTGLSILRDKVHMFGSTAGWYWEQPQGSISLGGWAQGGQGSTPSLENPGGKPVAKSNYIYGLTIATSYRF